MLIELFLRVISYMEKTVTVRKGRDSLFVHNVEYNVVCKWKVVIDSQSVTDHY